MFFYCCPGVGSSSLSSISKESNSASWFSSNTIVDSKSKNKITRKYTWKMRSGKNNSKMTNTKSNCWSTGNSSSRTKNQNRIYTFGNNIRKKWKNGNISKDKVQFWLTSKLTGSSLIQYDTNDFLIHSLHRNTFLKMLYFLLCFI